MKRQWFLVGLVALAVVALCVIAYLLFYGNSPADNFASSSEKYGIKLTEQDRAQGSPNAPILMVEYAAPTCPVCAHFDMDIFPLIKKNYIDTGKVYYVFRVYPLSAVDVAAESMARCLPKENYFPFIDMLYHNQPKWDPDGNVIPDVRGALVQMGAVAGMSAQEVNTCIDNTTEQAAITKIGQDAQATYNVNGTPSFIVNGQMRVGASTWEDWQDYLNTMLAKK
ncbi:MAG TPA: DsbA family protein [Rhizomicrobium sp.]|nr:DsbA family protein [Rhizomicrobium sp.]